MVLLVQMVLLVLLVLTRHILLYLTKSWTIIWLILTISSCLIVFCDDMD